MRTAARPTSAERFAARARRQRLRRLARAFALLLGMAAIVAVVWLVGWSAVLAVEEVRVEGAPATLEGQVIEVAAVPMGRPLARLDTRAVAERVGEIPDVGGVEVHRSWPSAVTIEVAPRVPAAVIADDDTWWRVDAAGVVFAPSTTKPEALPVLAASVDEDDTATRAAGVAVLTSLPAGLRDLVTSAEADSEADIRLTLTDGAIVRWGTSERNDDKAAVLIALIADQDEPPTVYDVSAPDHPAVQP